MGRRETRAGARGLGRIAGSVGLGAILVVAASELMHWAASRRYLPASPPSGPGSVPPSVPASVPPSVPPSVPGSVPPSGPGSAPPSDPPSAPPSEAVIVLGCPPKRNGEANSLQRWRCQIAARSLAGPGQMIFSGAGRPGRPSEAAVMSGYAHDVLGVPAGQIALETKARTTWQNVEFAVPIAAAADVIRFASDPMHAARARHYLRLQRPDLADRLGPSADYRFGEHWGLKVLTAGYQLARTLWRSRRLRDLVGAGRSLASGSVRRTG